MATPQKKLFKLSMLGLIKWESEDWTVKEIALIMGMIMAFILLMVILLNVYAIPTLGAPVALKQIATGLGKIIKSRSP